MRQKKRIGSRVHLKDREGLFKDSDGLRGSSCCFHLKTYVCVNTVFLEITKGAK